MKDIRLVFLFFLILWTGRSCAQQAAKDIEPNAVVPTSQQIAYQKMELIGFIHFGVNTFSNREWGTGREDPGIFNPTKLDARQWAAVAKKAGIRELIITAKHHDGFCLWPSKYTSHSVKSSPWKNGKGDVVKELSEACREEGIRLGIYLSPWDMHEPTYGTSGYNQYYLNQLGELLTGYGTVSEVWMDGAKGENAKNMEYDFDAYRSLIRRLQPDALIFSDAGPGVRWIGNEKGIAGTTNWSMINNDQIKIGHADPVYLNEGDPRGNRWLPGECDVSIRPGWFYHASQDTLVKSPRELVDLYYKSVGRNGTLLLNLPPDQDGLWKDKDINNLLEFRSILDETFYTDLALGKKVTASGWRLHNDRFSPLNVTDSSDESYWAADDQINKSWLEIDLGSAVPFDRIMIQEPIRFGQRISGFTLEARVGGEWKTISRGTTVGYKRLLRIEPVTADKVRLDIVNANNTPAISHFGIYKASSREPLIVD